MLERKLWKNIARENDASKKNFFPPKLQSYSLRYSNKFRNLSSKIMWHPKKSKMDKISNKTDNLMNTEMLWCSKRCQNRKNGIKDREKSESWFPFLQMCAQNFETIFYSQSDLTRKARSSLFPQNKIGNWSQLKIRLHCAKIVFCENEKNIVRSRVASPNFRYVSLSLSALHINSCVGSNPRKIVS